MTKPPGPVLTAPRQCPICGRPISALHQSFCSARCADIDLGRWLKGNYRIAGEEEPDETPEGEER
jgi:uncharacterized protein